MKTPHKPIVILPHARFEMRRRGIGVAEVEAAVRNPGRVLSSKKGRRVHQVMIVAGRMLLRVVVKEDAMAYRVITAYKTSRVEKYWRKS